MQFDASASPVFNLEPTLNQQELGSYVEYVEDPLAKFSVNSPKKLKLAHWQKNNTNTFSKGYSRSIWWLKLSINNSSTTKINKLLEMRYPVLDNINVYQVTGDFDEIKMLYTLGDKINFAQRPFDNRHFVVPLQFQPNTKQQYLLKIKSSSAIQLPLILSSSKQFLTKSTNEYLILGIWLGSLVIMLFYNAILYSFDRNSVYLFYIFYVISMGLFLASFHGLTFQYLWPGATFWNDQVILFSLIGVVMFAALFTKKLLDINDKTPLLNALAYTVCVLSAILWGACFFFSYEQLIIPVIANAAFAIAGGGYVSVKKAFNGLNFARYYIMAWFMIFLGGILLALSKLQVLPSNIITENAVILGSSFEVLLLSFAVGVKINREKIKLLEAEKKLTQLQLTTNLELERKVNERTKELERVNQQLAEVSETDALTGLKNRRYLNQKLQTEIIQSITKSLPLSFILLDIDHFKKFNDTYGHQIGDECLIAVGKVLKQQANSFSCFSGRHGGEEFAVILPNISIEQATHVAESIRVAIEQMTFVVAQIKISITISAGVASIIPSKLEQASLLLSHADQALYQAKSTSRNCVKAYKGVSDPIMTIQ